MWYEVTCWCEDGPFRLITDDRDEALDFAAYNEKKFAVAPSKIEEFEDEA